MFVFNCILIYVVEIFPGVPVFLFLRRRGLDGLRTYALAGLAVVGVPVALWIVWALSKAATPVHLPAYRLVPDLLNLGVSGLLTGTTFWAISRRRIDRRSVAEVFE